MQPRVAGLGGESSTPAPAAPVGRCAGRAATEEDAPPAWELSVPYKRTKLEGERVAIRAAREGLDVLVVNPTTPVGPGDRRPTPTGKMVADVAHGRARAHLAGGALNVVAVEDVAAGHLLAHEHGRPAERYLLGGENLTMREVFALVASAAGRPPPRIAIPWRLAHAAARLADAALGAVGRQPSLLVLDEVRLAREPMLFDDSKARRELGYRSRPAADALAAAARAALGIEAPFSVPICGIATGAADSTPLACVPRPGERGNRPKPGRKPISTGDEQSLFRAKATRGAGKFVAPGRF